jgi:hypothetical membrane protein
MDIPAAAPSRFEKTALASGVAAPVLYFASVAAGAMMYPGFSVIRQFASDLGAQDAPHPLILNVGVVLSGVAVGLAGSIAVARRLGSDALFGVSIHDATVLGAVAAVLIATALLANGVPARRAARIDPMRSLRTE